jgi:hypothetical protein
MITKSSLKRELAMRFVNLHRMNNTDDPRKLVIDTLPNAMHTRSISEQWEFARIAEPNMSDSANLTEATCGALLKARDCSAEMSRLVT